MILYFFDRRWNPLGKASSKLPRSIFYYDDKEVEDVETGTSTFEVYVGFDEENRQLVKTYGDEGNYIVAKSEDGTTKIWTIIDDESDEAGMYHYFYAEDAGMDLLNETLPAWMSPGKAQPVKYYVEKAVYDSGFEIGNNEISNLSRTLTWDGEATALNRLQSILTQFDHAELQFRFVINEYTMELEHKYIDILKKRGTDTGETLKINREVENIRMKRSRANLVNAYRATGATPEGKDKPIDLMGYKLTTEQQHINPETGKARFKIMNSSVLDTESNAKYSRYLNPNEQGTVGDAGYYTGIYTSEATSQKTLADEVINKLKKTSEPEINFEVDVVDASKNLKVGDTVNIVNDAGEQYLEGRLLKTERSRSNDTFEIVLGDYLIKQPGVAEQFQAMADQLKGKDGVSNYIFYAYADDEKGTGISLDPTGKAYVGITTDTVDEQPMNPTVYTWSKYVGKDGNKGDDGRGIIDTIISYQSSTSGTTVPTGSWLKNPPLVSGNQYLWTRTQFSYSDNTHTFAYSVGRMGASGEAGVGVKNVDVEYQAGSSGVTAPTGTWNLTPPTVAANQYLWTRVTTTYTDNKQSIAYSIGKMGANGADAKLLYLTATAETMNFDADDNPKATQTITISAKLQNVTGTATFKAIPYIGNTAQAAINLGGTGNDRTLTSSQWTNKQWTMIAITATLNGLTDTLSIVKVNDGKEGEAGEDGKTSYVHHAWAWSADGKDRFTTVYPNENLIPNSKFDSTKGWNLGGVTGWVDSGTLVCKKSSVTSSRSFISINPYILLDLSNRYSSYIELYFDNDCTGVAGSSVFLRTFTSDTIAMDFGVVALPGNVELGKWIQYRLPNRAPNSTSDVTKGLQYAVALANGMTGTIRIRQPKVAIGQSAEPYTTAPSEDYENAYPTYSGTYTDFNETASIDPSKYTWQRIIGNSGKDGEPGEDGNDAQEVFSGYLSNEAIILPANASGTVTDFSKANGSFVTYLGQKQLTSGVAYSLVSQTGITATINATTGVYSVSAASSDSGMAVFKAVYQGVTIQKILSVTKAKQGGTGATGSTGPAGKGISSTTITYQASTSGSTVPTGTWSPTIPSVAENQYLWTKTVLTFTDNSTSSPAYSVGKMGAKGATGATGATGKGVKSTAVTYQASTSGTVTPTGTWLTSIPSVSAGSYLWTKTVITYTDNGTSTSYSIGKMGNTGPQGNPTGVTESTTVPTGPYIGMLWKCTGTPTGYLKNTVYRWNGSQWGIWTFSAVNIIAETFNGLTFTGITMKASEFISNYNITSSSVNYSGELTIGTGLIRNEYSAPQNGINGVFQVDRIGNITNGRTLGNGFQQYELSPGGLALNDGAYSGILTAQALTKTPWMNLVYGSGYSVAENNNMQYRIIYQPDGSRLIRFRGQFKKSDNSTLPANTSIYPIGDATHTIPKAIHPARTEFGYAATNSGNGGRLAVSNTGMFIVTLASASTYVSISGIQYILD